MQDVEFTIERGKLWMLQTRNGKRTAKAAIKIAVDMANERLITKEEAVMRVTPDNVDSLLHPQFDDDGQEGRREGRQAAGQGRECLARRGGGPGSYFDADTGRGEGQGRHRRHHGPPRSPSRMTCTA